MSLFGLVVSLQGVIAIGRSEHSVQDDLFVLGQAGVIENALVGGQGVLVSLLFGEQGRQTQIRIQSREIVLLRPRSGFFKRGAGEFEFFQLQIRPSLPDPCGESEAWIVRFIGAPRVPWDGRQIMA